MKRQIKNILSKIPPVKQFLARMSNLEERLQDEMRGLHLDLKDETSNAKAELQTAREEIEALRREQARLASVLQDTKKEMDYQFYKGLHPDNYIRELKDWYKQSTGMSLCLENPQTFNEKIQWLKIYDSTPLKTRLADKFLVRDWVKEQIGEQYLIPLLGVWDQFDQIDFDRLPDQFVLKANHGCGWNIIVKDKNVLDKAEAKRKMDKWLNTNFAFCNGLELHYKDIPPRIIAEAFLENEGRELYDYKIWCFNGKPEFIVFMADRHIELKVAFYDPGWNRLPFVYTFPRYEKSAPKPENLDEMLKLAEALSKDFIHARVDFYALDDGSVKFGEMTFTTASGECRWNPPEYDLIVGQMMTLPKSREAFKK